MRAPHRACFPWANGGLAAPQEIDEATSGPQAHLAEHGVNSSGERRTMSGGELADEFNAERRDRLCSSAAL
ncbi:MAG: hypothetical protein WCG96_08515 [Actinomycetes bacterium]